MLALKSSLKGLINAQNHMPKTLNHLCTLESVPISQSDKKETGLLGSYIINLLYSLHIPITIVVGLKKKKKGMKKVIIHIHLPEMSRWRDTKVVSGVLL